MKRVVLTVLFGLLVGALPVAAQQVPADTAEADSAAAEPAPRNAPNAPRMDRPAADTIPADRVREEMARRQRAEGRRVPLDGSGTAILADWPPSLTDLVDRMGRRAPRLLPKLDSLLIDYSYAAGDDIVDMTFGLQWQPGQTVLYRGDVIPRSEGPPDIRMSSFEIILDVVKGGRKVAETLIAVDSMALPPAPGYYEFNVRVPYEQVFLETGPEAAERYLKEGVTLERPLIEVMGFQEFRNGRAYGDVETSRRDDAPRDEPQARPRTESGPPPAVYRPRVGVLIGWRIGPNPYYVGPTRRRPAPARPDADDAVVARPTGDSDRTGRAATAGRTTDRDDTDGDDTGRTGRAGQADGGQDAGEQDTGNTERTGRSSGTASNGDGKSDEGRSSAGRSKSGRDDDEDDDSLVPAALGAAAAVAVLGYAGGTVGLYGSGDTPLGLTAGVTRSRGGIHLQAAINPEVIEQEGTQRLNVKLMGFYDVIGDSPIQPAASVGVQAVAINDSTDLLGAASLGLALNTGRFVIFGGYDLPRNTAEISLSYNFRFGG